MWLKLSREWQQAIMHSVIQTLKILHAAKMRSLRDMSPKPMKVMDGMKVSLPTKFLYTQTEHPL